MEESLDINYNYVKYNYVSTFKLRKKINWTFLNSISLKYFMYNFICGLKLLAKMMCLDNDINDFRWNISFLLLR